MKVTKIMTNDVIVAYPESSLYDVAHLMKQHNIGFVPILNGKRLAGIVTDRDLAIRGYAEKKSESAPVRDVMTSDVVTIGKDASVDDAAAVMAKNKIRCVCVIDDDRNLIGVCAIGDFAADEWFDDEAGYALSQISKPSPRARL